MIKVYMKDETSEGQSFDFHKDIIYVGRLPDNDVQIRDRSVSRKHLKIMKRDYRYFIEDLESKNGTFVHGRPVWRM
jgi:pSer/pThr/pTyr-binding forkhead associated (FHA) protein